MLALPLLLVLSLLLSHIVGQCHAFSYRTAKPSDFPMILNLLMENESSNSNEGSIIRSRYKSQLKLLKGHARLVAVDHVSRESIIGYLELSTLPSPIDAEEVPYVANLIVSHGYRRQGVGTRLVQLAWKICKPRVFLSVDLGNEAALKLYHTLGFQSILDESIDLSFTARQKLKRPMRVYLEKKERMSEAT